MTISRRLLAALSPAAALLAPRAAAPAAVPGHQRDGRSPPTATRRAGWRRARRLWRKDGPARSPTSARCRDHAGVRDQEVSAVCRQGEGRGLRMLLTVTGSAGAPSTRGASSRRSHADLATQFRGKGVDYEMWNEPDDSTLEPQLIVASPVTALWATYIDERGSTATQLLRARLATIGSAWVTGQYVTCVDPSRRTRARLARW